MKTQRLYAVVGLALSGLLAWGCPGGGSKDDAGTEDAWDGAGDPDEPMADADGAAGDDGEVSPDGDGAGGDDAGDADDGGDADLELPRLGVYTVNTDGTDLRLLFDAGTRAVTHVRQLPGTTWMTGTRYTKDPDGNGLAMEVEADRGAFYDQTEIIVFDRRAPDQVTVIAGGVDGQLCANSSWTADGTLIHIQQDDPVDPDRTRIKRVRFSQIPQVASSEVVPVPDALIMPVDPHQAGPSDATGTLVLTALIQLAPGWSRPVWKLPASGSLDMQAVEFVGCPICPDQAGCCAWPDLADVLGTNDARLNHAGTAVSWMQQHPDISAQVGPITIKPWRQVIRVFGQDQVDLPTGGAADTTNFAFGAWNPDDSRLTYWTIEFDPVVKHRLYTMAPDGTDRQRVPIPDELCPTHPNFIGPDRLVFTAWRCGSGCSCSPESL